MLGMQVGEVNLHIKIKRGLSVYKEKTDFFVRSYYHTLIL